MSAMTTQPQTVAQPSVQELMKRYLTLRPSKEVLEQYESDNMTSQISDAAVPN